MLGSSFPISGRSCAVISRRTPRVVIVPVSEGCRTHEYSICFLTHLRVSALACEQDDDSANEDRR
jgi:hypothetical protein